MSDSLFLCNSCAGLLIFLNSEGCGTIFTRCWLTGLCAHRRPLEVKSWLSGALFFRSASSGMRCLLGDRWVSSAVILKLCQACRGDLYRPRQLQQRPSGCSGVLLICSSQGFPLQSMAWSYRRIVPSLLLWGTLVPAPGGVLMRPKGKRGTLPLQLFALQGPAHPSLPPGLPGTQTSSPPPGLCLGPSCPVVWKLGAEPPAGSLTALCPGSRGPCGPWSSVFICLASFSVGGERGNAASVASSRVEAEVFS